MDLTTILGAGIYFLSLKGVVVYVGQGRRVLTRVYTHKNVLVQARKGKRLTLNGRTQKVISFDQVQMLPCAEADLNALEKEWIAKLRPKHNVAHVVHKMSLAELGLVIGGVSLNLDVLNPSAGFSGLRRI